MKLGRQNVKLFLTEPLGHKFVLEVIRDMFGESRDSEKGVHPNCARDDSSINHIEPVVKTSFSIKDLPPAVH